MLVSLFTWYGKQQFNNPFAPVHRIIIAGNAESLSLYLEQTVRKKTPHLLVINPDSCLRTVTKPTGLISLSETWDYLSIYTPPHRCIPEKPPRHWYLLDSAGLYSSFHRSDWPDAHLLVDTTIGATSLKRVFPFEDQRSALYLQFSGASILLIDDPDFNCTTADTTSFKEKLELLIVAKSTSHDHIEQCREVFRPRFTVVSCSSEVPPPSFPNLYRFSSEKLQQITFRVEKNLLITVADDSSPLH